ncbi:armadillo repeat-containing protein 1 isoform X2 [Gasterosteus aculeatus]
MSAEPDPLAVVNQLRDLAADPMNRRAIVQDQGCLPGLILFLDNPNPQAIRYLAEHRANQEQLKEELGMLPSLQNVTQKSTTPGETKLLASEIYELLRSCSSGSSSARAQEAVSSRRRKAQFFMGSSNKRAKTVVLHIDGLDDYGRRGQCEEALLRIRGVISFTFQMTTKRCVVRIRSDLKAEDLGSAIASTQVMTAQQVVRAENGDEVFVPLVEDGSAPAQQGVDLPDYLPEEDSPSQEPDKALLRLKIIHPSSHRSSCTRGLGGLESIQQTSCDRRVHPGRVTSQSQGYTETHNHSHTYRQLESPTNLIPRAGLWTVGGTRRTRREPHRHGENMQTPHRKASGPSGTRTFLL